MAWQASRDVVGCADGSEGGYGISEGEEEDPEVVACGREGKIGGEAEVF